jgi:hypothetical protein
MSFRAIVFAGLLGLAVAALATVNLNCSVLSALADGGGGGGGTDGGGGGGTDGGGEPADGGGATTGSVKVTVTCGGDGCTKQGNLIVEAKACGGAVIKADTSKTDQTLTSGTPIEVVLTDIPAGAACVTGFLDVDKNGSKNQHDVQPSAGEVSVTVAAGAETPAALELNQLVP